MSENNCRNCRYFNGFDGVGELWTLCSNGDFQGTRNHCEYYEKKVTRVDLLKKLNELQEELELLKEQLKECRKANKHYKQLNRKG